jgi:eukaryotic-like serine/threonine-protein kinase
VGSSDLRQRLERTLGDHYTLERELGNGGIFVAQETQLGRSVVVKAQLPELAAGVSVERFRREIALISRSQRSVPMT